MSAGSMPALPLPAPPRQARSPQCTGPHYAYPSNGHRLDTLMCPMDNDCVAPVQA